MVRTEAAEIQKPSIDKIEQEFTEEEKMVINDCLRSLEYVGGETEFYELYDMDGGPGYIMGVNEVGYSIYDRTDLSFCEAGEGNPYDGYMDQKLYYREALLYYVRPEDEISTQTQGTGELEFYDIIRQEPFFYAPKEERAAEREQIAQRFETENQADSYAATQNYAVKLDNNVNCLRRVAFGFNDDNRCSAVATGLALSYIANEYNMDVVVHRQRPELMEKGSFGSRVEVAKNYPNAHELFRTISYDYGMGPVSFSLGITNRVNDYSSEYIYPWYRYNLHMTSTIWPKKDTIEKNIRSNIPVLITTVIDSEFPTHTMCVYGFRMYSNEAQILVHSGWYTKNIERSSGSKSYIQKEIWVKESIAKFGYYFTFDNPLSYVTDMPDYNDWRFSGINYVMNNGIMAGMTDTTFVPEQRMTRAMIVSTLYRMAGSPDVRYQKRFTDVPNGTWYSKAVIWGANNGIVAGINNQEFDPKGIVSREQMLTFMYRFAKYMNWDTSVRANLTGFSDYGKISNYAKDAMSWAYARGILEGSGSKLYPQNHATRAEAAAFLMRLARTYDLYPE